MTTISEESKDPQISGVHTHSLSHTHTFFSIPIGSILSREIIIQNPTSGHQSVLAVEGNRVNSKVSYPYPMRNLMGKSKQGMLKHWPNAKKKF